MATGNGRTLLKIMQTDPNKRKQYLKELELKKKQGKTAVWKKGGEAKKGSKGGKTKKSFSKMNTLERLKHRRKQTEDALKLL